MITYYLVIEVTCLVASMLFLRKGTGTVWRLQIAYLVAVCFTEAYGTYLTKVSDEPSNQWVYNLYLPFIPVFIGLLLHDIIDELVPVRRRWLHAAWMLCASSYLLETLVNGGISSYLYHTRLLVNVLICIACLYYFVMQFRIPGYRPIQRAPGFWWVLGTFFFYLGHTVVNRAHDFISQNKDTIILGAKLHMVLFIILLTSLYGLWSYAFYLRWRNLR